MVTYEAEGNEHCTRLWQKFSPELRDITGKNFKFVGIGMKIL